ncbi:hypothetical protein EYF80_035788 [Liparis tanakae]|uniref:Uncharacterized protein n=1 Tax=Liparis tanakae TaxID=230148 RepID=A0A4Z2GLC6_9TELE|nr:hypothetical protein EYF80_035788 [Liparis tanakae]
MTPKQTLIWDHFTLLQTSNRLTGDAFQLVSRNKLPQHSGDHDKLRPVRIYLDSEEQPAQVGHLLFGAFVVSTQVQAVSFSGAQFELGGDTVAQPDLPMPRSLCRQPGASWSLGRDSRKR